jgi:general secretion pathway protein D
MTRTRLFLMAAIAAAIGGCAVTPSTETKLVQNGFEHILNQQWSEAETVLLQALESNADDPYALLNLGVVYQQTGRNEEAREMYNRVIESDTTLRAGRSNLIAVRGRPLTELAQENLDRMSRDGAF